MRSSFALLTTSIAVLVAMAPGPAAANPLFPPTVQTDAPLSYTPPCTICHLTLAGGTGTAIKPFALAMRGAGLTDPLPGTVGPALTMVAAAMPPIDSDCDGTPDVQQLKDGRDPNFPGEYIDNSGKATPSEPGCGADAGTSTPELPAFGCGAQLAPAPAQWSGAAVLVAALGAALARVRSAGSARRAARARLEG